MRRSVAMHGMHILGSDWSFLRASESEWLGNSLSHQEVLQYCRAFRGYPRAAGAYDFGRRFVG